MQCKVVVAIGIIVVGGWLTAPPAVADDGPCVPGSPCNFVSPSGNIACQLTEAAPAGTQGSAAQAYCQTNSPPQSVMLDQYGSPTLVGCTADSCTLQAGQGYPTLAYGQTARHSVFTCVSEAAGVTCTTPSGGGFTISRSGITKVG
jgi:hypothetical protein